ncbi:MAG TPA: NAD-dependent epimerase/dehydratase family protein [Roseiflexaceae bacterium]|nr:NAD-dependent epimerase/dehydratase family protein [Roseiflexaceae bacterium]HMP40831.1 NAD-dependent epimerase/dehydratase family protein [Roseiflexaceae bacterium]
MKTVLVTGGGGFIGSTLVDQLLARGVSVRVIGRSAYPQLAARGVTCIQLDLAAADERTLSAPLATALAGCDTVFHVAARAGVWGSLDSYYRTNLLGTLRLVRAAARAGAARLIYTSSPSVVFGDEDVAGADESTPYATRYLAPYPYTKALAERYVLRQQAIAAVAVRPPLVWGPGDPHILPRLITRARAGRLAQIGDGTNMVDVTYVENAAEAHILAADALARQPALHGRAYFIGQEHAVNMWQFIGEIIAHAGAPAIRRRLPLPLALAIAGTLEDSYRRLRIAHEPPFTRLTVTQLARSRWFDLSAARRDLGYGPRISLAEGLQRTFATPPWW